MRADCGKTVKWSAGVSYIEFEYPTITSSAKSVPAVSIRAGFELTMAESCVGVTTLVVNLPRLGVSE